MAKKKKIEEEKEFEKKLEKVEFPECAGGQSKREDEIIDLLKQLVYQNEKVIQLIEMLKDRFV